MLITTQTAYRHYVSEFIKEGAGMGGFTMGKLAPPFLWAAALGVPLYAGFQVGKRALSGKSTATPEGKMRLLRQQTLLGQQVKGPGGVPLSYTGS